MNSGNGSQVGMIVFGIVVIIALVLAIIAMWKIFTKAGEKGWKSLIPFYNWYILAKIADGNGWKFLLLIIPIVDIVFSIMLLHRLSKSFGKGTGFTVGLIFLPNIFYLILGLGSAQYIGPQGPQK